MSAKLFSSLGGDFSDAINFEKFFTRADVITMQNKFEAREKKSAVAPMGVKQICFLVFSSMAPGITIFSQKRKEPIRM